MPRYFFDAVDGGLERDSRGLLCADHDAARIEGIKLTGRIISEDPNYVWAGQPFRIEVRDDDGVHLFTVITMAISTSAMEMAK